MRRTRFARAVERAGRSTDRVSIGEALWFDLRSPETPDAESLFDTRIVAFDHAALLLGMTHLLGCAAIFLYNPAQGLLGLPFTSLLSIGLILALDLAAAIALRFRDRLHLKPQAIVRAMLVYIGATGLLWTLAAVGLTAGRVDAQAALPLLTIGAGITMASIVAVHSPPIALVNMAVAIVATLMLTEFRMISVGIAAIGVIMVAYSIANTRTVLAAGRRLSLIHI